ncbi:MAG: MFS transporter [Pseudomonadales bacterium]|nr:MFS transporter [Pseudomonadales bacterium]
MNWKPWAVLGLLMLASIVSFVDRQVVAIVVEPMKADLGISDTEVGWLYGVFAVFYALAAWPIAFLADQKSRKHIIATGIFFWSIMTVLCGLSRQYWQILAARVGVGVGEASLGPATVSIVGDLFPRKEVPLALSVFQTAAVMGSGLAFIIGGVVLELVQGGEPMHIPFVGDIAPWQQTFIYVGLPGLLLAAAFLFLREPKRRSAPSAENSIATLKEFYRTNARLLFLHHFGFLSFALLGYAFVFWSVSYFVRVHGMEASTAAQNFGWIFLVTGPIGPVLAAMYARWLTSRGRRDGNIVAGMVTGCLAVPSIIAIQFAPNETIAYLLYVPAMIFVNAPFGLANGSLPVIAPARIHAQVAAIYLFVVSIGNLLGPPMAGFFNEVVFPDVGGVRYSIITVCAVFGIVGGVLLYLARKPYAEAWRLADEL